MVQRELARRTKQQDGEVTAFSEKLWCGLLDYATAYADGRLTFTLKTAPASRAEPGKCNAPDHRVYAGDRELFAIVSGQG